MVKKTRDPKPGELSEIAILETFERMNKRPESRMDALKLLESLSDNGKLYARHLIMTGPTSTLTAAKSCGLTVRDIEEALLEIQKAIIRLRSAT